MVSVPLQSAKQKFKSIQEKEHAALCFVVFSVAKKTGPESTTIEGAAHAKLQHLAKKLKQLIFTG